jgi:hypothetical protein
LYYGQGKINMKIAGTEAAFVTVAKICGRKEEEQKNGCCWRPVHSQEEIKP